MASAARIIAGFGPKAVLVKGGHMIEGDVVTDILFANGAITRFDSPRIPTENTHGTGCTLSAAIAAELAAGSELPEAVRKGRQYLMLALKRSFRPDTGRPLDTPWSRVALLTLRQTERISENRSRHLEAVRLGRPLLHH
jgi:hydroxymethylpyrimidine/phosphomethylpyrimidine kinase